MEAAAEVSGEGARTCPNGETEEEGGPGSPQNQVHGWVVGTTSNVLQRWQDNHKAESFLGQRDGVLAGVGEGPFMEKFQETRNPGRLALTDASCGRPGKAELCLVQAVRPLPNLVT